MYAFLDLETTGLNYVLDEICEIAILIYDKDFKLKKEYHSYLNTYRGIPEDVSLIHGITNEMVADKPYFSDVAKEIKKLLEGKILCGQNIRNFDLPMLAEQFFNLDIEFDTSEIKTLDTFSIEQLMNPRDLSSLYKKYTGLDLVDAHTAKADCIAAKDVLMKQVETYGLNLDLEDSENSLNVKEKYVDPSRKLIWIDGAVCWAMGKNKDKTVLSDIPYANWALESSFPNSTKFYIKKELDKIKK